MDQFPKVPFDKNLKSTTNETLPNPYLHSEYRKVPHPKGPRELLLEQQLKNDIENEYNSRKNEEQIETLKIDYRTSQQLANLEMSNTLSNKQNNYSSSLTNEFNYTNDIAISFFTQSDNGTPGKKTFKRNAAFSSGKYDM